MFTIEQINDLHARLAATVERSLITLEQPTRL